MVSDQAITVVQCDRDLLTLFLDFREWEKVTRESLRMAAPSPERRLAFRKGLILNVGEIEVNVGIRERHE